MTRETVSPAFRSSHARCSCTCKMHPDPLRSHPRSNPPIAMRRRADRDPIRIASPHPLAAFPLRKFGDLLLARRALERHALPRKIFDLGNAELARHIRSAAAAAHLPPAMEEEAPCGQALEVGAARTPSELQPRLLVVAVRRPARHDIAALRGARCEGLIRSELDREARPQLVHLCAGRK